MNFSFQAPQNQTAYHPARGNDHPARGNDTKETILIRNLDTGEARYVCVFVCGRSGVRWELMFTCV